MSSTPKKIFLLLGHPDKETYSGALASAYEDGAKSSGFEVRRVDLGEVEFDPILHKGYKEIQELEQGLVDIQENIKWADHIVIVYPNWWNTMPALLKGMFDRMFLPGFAFKINKETKKCEKLLKGRSARIVIVAGTHSPFKTRLLFGDYTNELEKGILGFSGISPVNVSSFGPAEHVSQEVKEKWKSEILHLGRRGI